MDYFSLEGKNFLAIGDRFSGWLSIYEAGPGQFDAKSLVNKVRGWCESFNIPEEIVTDGGPQLTSTVFQDSLRAWDVRQLKRMSGSKSQIHVQSLAREEVQIDFCKYNGKDFVFIVDRLTGYIHCKKSANQFWR